VRRRNKKVITKVCGPKRRAACVSFELIDGCTPRVTAVLQFRVPRQQGGRVRIMSAARDEIYGKLKRRSDV